ncbi:MAG TPA: OsmC family peroxiredoxin [Dehalococcoidia bacterium]|jgi:osmotically inducible protein OsmC|nr:OsmC family peroxiredoxin [Dehalococcoidia bacterium]
MAIQNKAEVVWEGGLANGSGHLSVGTGAFPEQTVRFGGRTEPAAGMTNPEELLAAAHAVCFSMAFAHRLGQNQTPPEKLDVATTCTLERTEGGLKITAMDLAVSGDVPGMDAAEFQRLATEAEQKCPVSNALRGNIDIRLTARPVASPAR